MNPDQLKAYKRDKSKKFNAHLRDLRLKEKKRIADNQPDQQPDKQDNTIDNQDDDQPDNLTLQDLLDIFSTLENKLDLIDNKLESIIETKISEETFKTNQPINRLPSIFFA